MDMKCAEYHAFLMCLCRSAAAEVQSLFHGPRMRQAEFSSIWRDHLAQKNVRAKLYQAVVAQALEAAVSLSMRSPRCALLNHMSLRHLS